MRSARGTGLVMVGVLGVLLVVLAAVLVPWDPVPGGALALPDADELFTPEELAQAEHRAWWARLWSWSSLVVGLVVACVLGFTSLGPRLVARLRRRARPPAIEISSVASSPIARSARRTGAVKNARAVGSSPRTTKAGSNALSPSSSSAQTPMASSRSCRMPSGFTSSRADGGTVVSASATK